MTTASASRERLLDPAPAPVPSRPARWCYYLSASLCLAVWPALILDLWLARALIGGWLPGDLRRILTWSEAFAHGLGVALIVLAAAILDPGRRPSWPRVLCMAYGAGLTADAVKLLIGRYRPRTFLALAPQEASVRDTFLGLMTSLTHGLDHARQSFPSAHTATAVGFAVGLARVYPRARWLLVCLTLLAAGQRLDAGAHFLSDVAAGAAIGLLIGGLATEPRLLGSWFDRWETRVRPRP